MFFEEKALKEEWLAQMSERQESQQEKAQRIVREGLRRRGGTEGDLNVRNKGDRQKVQIAQSLGADTLVTTRWIAKRLRIGGVWPM